MTTTATTSQSPGPPGPFTSYPSPSQRTQNTRNPCTRGPLLRELCHHGHYRWFKAPCNRWSCPDCGEHRLYHDLLPEIRLAYLAGLQLGQLLKFVTLTWKGDNPAAQFTPAGDRRARLDLAHWCQDLKRQGIPHAYLKVAERHQSGQRHLHLLMVSPYIRQTHLSRTWKRHTRGSFVVDVCAVGFKCPHCYDAHIADRKERRKRIIVYNPKRGVAKCRMCSSVVNVDDAIATTCLTALWEIGKYLLKDKPSKLSRNKAWQVFHKQASQQNKPNGSLPTCPECNKPHTFVRWPYSIACEMYPDELDAGELGIPWIKEGVPPCNCWPKEDGWQQHRQSPTVHYNPDPRPPPDVSGPGRPQTPRLF